MIYMFRKWFGNNYTETNIVNKCLPDTSTMIIQKFLWNSTD